jgi:tetratricopeptide (TPR) repeat protein
VGKLLGVEKLVVGSFQIFMGSINLNSRIVNVESGEIDKDGIISNKRDQLDNIFQLQEAVSLMLVKAFGQAVSKKEEEKISAVTQSKGSLSAYEYYMKGWNAYNEKNYDAALENYEKAVELNPKYVDAFNNIGLIYYAREDYARARDSYLKAVEIDPNYAIGHYNLGLAYYQLKNYAPSMRHYQKSIELRPNYMYAYYGLGLTYYALQNYDKAMEYYQMAIDLDPRYDHVYYAAGLIYNARKQYAEAIRYYEKCLEVNPKYANAFLPSGWCIIIRASMSFPLRTISAALN